MATVGADGDPAKAKQAGLALGSFLRDLGFHLELAPVADVKTDPDNAVLGNRSFGTHPEQTLSLIHISACPRPTSSRPSRTSTANTP